MVLPYHKGLIIKKHFYLISWVYLHNLIFSYQIYNILGLELQQVVSELQQVVLELQQVVSEHFLGHKSGDFFLLFAGFQGRRVCRSDLYVLVQDLQNLIIDLYSL